MVNSYYCNCKSRCSLFFLLLLLCKFAYGIIYSDVKDSIQNLPDWLQEYVKWHDTQRRNHMNDPETKFLTVACHQNTMCGGISDRLRPLPYFLLLAQKTNRVLLIKWQKFELENFLLPPDGGIDWRLPDGMDIGNRVDLQTGDLDYHAVEFKSTSSLANKTNVIVKANRDLYDFIRKKHFVTNDHPEGTFGYIWKVLFQPTPQLQLSIDKTMNELNLVPGKYVSAHHRSKDHTFADSEIKDGVAISLTVDDPKHQIDNVLACAYQISPDKSFPIYFTASNTENVRFALEESDFVKKNQNVEVIGITNVLRLHSDKPYRVGSYDHDASELYPAFIDLYLMANGACVSHGVLGFGKLGARMSGEKCMIDNRFHTCNDVVE